MKVFISWSGELSKNIAEIYRDWLPGVIQAVKPYYTPDDITKGSRWNNEISKELDAASIGIICLTRDNLDSSWIMFEAGALSKNIEESKVCPILFGIEPSDIKGPLVHFQAAKFSKGEMKKLIKMINSELGDNGLPTSVLDNVFEKWWPELDVKIQGAMQQGIAFTEENVRNDRELLEEILALTRRTSMLNVANRNIVHPEMLMDLIDTLNSLIATSETNSYNLITEISELVEAIDIIIKRSIKGLSNKHKDIIYSKWDLLYNVFGPENNKKFKVVGKIDLDKLRHKKTVTNKLR
jgi:hypothetical protein